MADRIRCTHLQPNDRNRKVPSDVEVRESETIRHETRDGDDPGYADRPRSIRRNTLVCVFVDRIVVRRMRAGS